MRCTPASEKIVPHKKFRGPAFNLDTSVFCPQVDHADQNGVINSPNTSFIMSPQNTCGILTISINSNNPTSRLQFTAGKLMNTSVLRAPIELRIRLIEGVGLLRANPFVLSKDQWQPICTSGGPMVIGSRVRRFPAGSSVRRRRE